MKYRVYFNCRDEAPYVWSYDTGPGTKEHQVKSVRFESTNGITRFDPTKHLPEASAWIEVSGDLVNNDGDVIIWGI